ncbi:11726_t:CDS:2, partial [Acaulospora morrowiae]
MNSPRILPTNNQDISELSLSSSTSESEYLNSGDRVSQNADRSHNNSETRALIPAGSKSCRKVRTETPLPKTPIFILSLIIFSEPINSTILLPFVYFMVRDFGVSKDEKQIGRYAGLIASSFFFSQFCFSIFWGYMSDKFGRRPILLIGLVGNIITSILFGISRSLIWAIASRSACGMLN